MNIFSHLHTISRTRLIAYMRRFFSLSIAILAWFFLIGWNQDPLIDTDPTLFIKTDEKTIYFKRSELLSSKDLTTILIEDDPAYHDNNMGRKMTYLGIPLKNLFNQLKISENATLQFQCLDGFSATISKKKIFDQSKEEHSIAYLAIEPPNKQWPLLKSPGLLKTAGPFYLVWVNSKLSNIKREEWPYQLAGFKIRKPLNELFPAIFPNIDLDKKSSIKRGFEVFTQNCFSCHTMNLQGESRLGPDLNVPMNPSEYFTTQALRMMIRDPQALRFWPQSKMHGFTKDQLLDSELDDLLDYLKHMTLKKVKMTESHSLIL